MTILASRLAKSINSCAVFGEREREREEKTVSSWRKLLREIAEQRKRTQQQKNIRAALNKVIPFEIQKNRCTDGGILYIYSVAVFKL